MRDGDIEGNGWLDSDLAAWLQGVEPYVVGCHILLCSLATTRSASSGSVRCSFKASGAGITSTSPYRLDGRNDGHGLRVDRPDDRVGLGRQEAEKVIRRFAFPDLPNRRPPRPDAGEKGEWAAIVEREPYRRTGAVRQNLVSSEAGEGDHATTFWMPRAIAASGTISTLRMSATPRICPFAGDGECLRAAMPQRRDGRVRRMACAGGGDDGGGELG